MINYSVRNITFLIQFFDLTKAKKLSQFSAQVKI